MILFDGIDIQSVASIKVEDVRVSSIKYSPLSRSRATSPGSVFGRHPSCRNSENCRSNKSPRTTN